MQIAFVARTAGPGTDTRNGSDRADRAWTLAILENAQWVYALGRIRRSRCSMTPST